MSKIITQVSAAQSSNSTSHYLEGNFLVLNLSSKLQKYLHYLLKTPKTKQTDTIKLKYSDGDVAHYIYSQIFIGDNIKVYRPLRANDVFIYLTEIRGENFTKKHYYLTPQSEKRIEDYLEKSLALEIREVILNHVEIGTSYEKAYDAVYEKFGFTVDDYTREALKRYSERHRKKLKNIIN